MKMTASEQSFYRFLASRPRPYAFEPQYFFNRRWLDFANGEYRVALEIDGEVHDDETRQINDANRDHVLSKRFHWEIIRKRRKVLLKDPEAVYHVLVRRIEARKVARLHEDNETRPATGRQRSLADYP